MITLVQKDTWTYVHLNSTMSKRTMQSAADYEQKAKSLESVHTMLHVDQGLTQRSSSATTVLTTMEGTGQCHQNVYCLIKVY